MEHNDAPENGIELFPQNETRRSTRKAALGVHVSTILTHIYIYIYDHTTTIALWSNFYQNKKKIIYSKVD